MKNKLMTHIVAGYPTKAQSVELLLRMQTAGVTAVEVQIPFSDPVADGPTIMMANDAAIRNTVTVRASFSIVNVARQKGLVIPVYLMTYANKLVSYGLQKFCMDAKACGAVGLIIPDLPIGSSEYNQTKRHCDGKGLDLIPVLSPGMSDVRLALYMSGLSKLVYVTSTKGITGKELGIHKDLLVLINKIRLSSSCEIALGFGIRNRSDVQKALKRADIAVIGSEVIRVIEKDGLEKATDFIKTLI
jgi:tryptophan synthase alpha subunit